MLSDHLVIKAFKYAFLWKEGSGKIDPYSVSKLLMCQMVSPSRQKISANFEGKHLLNYLVSQHVSEPAANQNLHLQHVSCFAIKFNPHSMSISLNSRSVISPK